MKTENQKLPEKLEPFRQQILPLHATKLSLEKQIAENDVKIRHAKTELDELKDSDPNDDANVRKLAEAAVRHQLFLNHGEKLKARVGETIQRAVQVVISLARELQKIGAEGESLGRAELIAEIGRLVMNSPVEISAALNNPFAPLRSRREEVSRVLRATAAYEPGEDPFEAIDYLVEALNRFMISFAAAEKATRTPVLS